MNESSNSIISLIEFFFFIDYSPMKLKDGNITACLDVIIAVRRSSSKSLLILPCSLPVIIVFLSVLF
jgi:hypothetical protein